MLRLFRTQAIWERRAVAYRLHELAAWRRSKGPLTPERLNQLQMDLNRALGNCVFDAEKSADNQIPARIYAMKLRKAIPVFFVFSILLALNRDFAATRPVAGVGPQSSASAGTWALVSRTPVDARLESEVSNLASRNQATVATFRSRSQAGRHHPALIIELRPAKSDRQFELDLARSAKLPKPAVSKPSPEAAREGYLLGVSYTTGRGSSELHQATITAAAPDGFHNALVRLAEVLRKLASGEPMKLFPEPKGAVFRASGLTAWAHIADWPSFPVRGVVEGFYGKFWSHQDRLDILRFEGQHGMNVYYYAPKDDPYHRAQWRDPYPPDRLAELGELERTARANFVDFCFAISPGLSMVYSSEEDFSKLTDKLGSVGKLGVSCYALFLDDVPEELQNPADKARFKSLAQAHAYIINKLYRQLITLDPHSHLTVTPTIYTNAFGHEESIRELGAAVNPHVALVWTGTKVVSPVITVDQARTWGKLLRRPPLIWDNYPVNDYMRWRPFLGPLIGRDPHLDRAVTSLVSNPMNEAHASMIPLQTIAEYLWNPATYNPEAAEKRAEEEQYGKEAPQVLAPFLATYGDYGWQDNILKPLEVSTRLPIDLPRINLALAPMESVLETLDARPGFEKLTAELSPFVEAARDRAEDLDRDPGFKHFPDEKVVWNAEYGALTARRAAAPPALDGDFGKWQQGELYNLRPAQAEAPPEAASAAHPPPNFDGSFALAWDDQYLYVGVDITDPEIYEPVPTPGSEDDNIGRGDMVALAIETAYRANYYATRTGADAFTLLLSPGNFNGIEPRLSINKSNLAPRLANYHQEIKTAWKKTAEGYSGDIAIPATFFTGAPFQEGYEIGLLVLAQKVSPSASAKDEESTERVRLTSKEDRFFAANPGNPSTYQHLVLMGQR